MLTFHKGTDVAKAARTLEQRLTKELMAHKRVLWLVSGGSNIPISIKVMNKLPIETHRNLAIMLTDERFGVYHHLDSNMLQLEKAGFQPGNATVIPVLTTDNLPLKETCARYNKAITTAFANADIIIGQFGMGADGHIAGILPNSPAVDSTDFVAGYDAKGFVRVTLTPVALKEVYVAYVFAYGKEKQEALENLQNKELDLKEQPAQVLKQIPESYVYNDQIGEAK